MDVREGGRRGGRQREARGNTQVAVASSHCAVAASPAAAQ